MFIAGEETLGKLPQRSMLKTLLKANVVVSTVCRFVLESVYMKDYTDVVALKQDLHQTASQEGGRNQRHSTGDWRRKATLCGWRGVLLRNTWALDGAELPKSMSDKAVRISSAWP